MSAQPAVRNTGRLALLVLLGAVVLAGLAAWWLHTYERVERDVPMPRTGEARRNPLYALQVALEKDGVAVRSRRRLQLFAGGSREPAVPLGARDTVVIYNDPRALAPAEVDGLLRWVGNGGHLIVRTPPMGLLATNSPVPLLRELELMPLGRDRSDCAEVNGTRPEPTAANADAAGDDPTADTAEAAGSGWGILFCGSRRFTLVGANPAYSWGDLKNG